MIKKTLIITMFLSIIFMITSFVLITRKNNTTSKLLSTKYIYNVIEDSPTKKEIIRIPLYYSSQTIFTSKDIISFISITNEEETSTIPLIINDIVKCGVSYYDKEKYITYLYECELPLLKNDFKIEEAYLKLKSNGMTLKPYIGSFNLIYKPNTGLSSNITFNSLEGVLIDSPFTNIAGININLENKINHNITINNISFLNENVIIDSSNIKENKVVTDLSVEYPNYHPITLLNNQNEININLLKYTSTDFFIPIKFREYFIFNRTPLIISYQNGGMEYEYVIDSFTLFDNNYEIPSVKEMNIIYDINWNSKRN